MIVAFGFASAIVTHAQTYQTLFEFAPADGGYPSSFVLGSDGNFYGTTRGGGTDRVALPGQGTVFEVTSSGEISTDRYVFCIQSGAPYKCTDGSFPVGVILGIDGNLYGVTSGGGANDNGTVFQLTPANVLTTLYSFCAEPNCTDGSSPVAGVIRGTDGNFYGTTYGGGANYGGTVYQLTPANVLTTLYSFCAKTNCVDGMGPNVLTQGNDGNFYGTTSTGGANGSYGTVFEITPTGSLTTLYSFCAETNCADGARPNVLIKGTGGDFYGTTSAGGANGSNGTFFQITPLGSLTTLYSFCVETNCADGSGPNSLIQGADGSFYGTTATGGRVYRRCVGGCGTLFSLMPGGVPTTLYEFCVPDCANGQQPDTVVQAGNGNFYGTTSYGGKIGAMPHCQPGCGVIYELSLSVALGPTFTPASQTFGKTKVNATSKPRNISIKNVNTGTTTLDFSSLTTSGPFAISANTCQATLAAGKSCKVSVTFTPTATGSATGTLSVSDNAPNSPQTVSLSGTGD